MFENNLTKDTYGVFCTIYKIYLDRRKQGLSKLEATSFYPQILLENELIKLNQEDINSCLCELKNNGYIQAFIDGEFTLLDSAIVLMENRFKKGITEVLETINAVFNLFSGI